MARPTGRRGRPAHPDVLTPAEWSVLHWLRHGLTPREVARLRGTSVEAVKFHTKHVAAKLGVRSRAALRAWPGVPADSAPARRKERTMTDAAPKLGAIGQISLFTNDVERSVTFYRDALELPHLFTFGTLAFFDCDGTRLFISTPEDGVWRASSVLYFRVDDIHASYDSLRGRGVTFEGAPHLIHRHESGVEEWMAFFNDPDGNTLALMAQIAPG